MQTRRLDETETVIRNVRTDGCQMCDMGPKSGTSGDQEELQEVLSGSWQSTTPACKPMTHDKIYYFLPYWDDKPCLHVRSIWPDYRRRMYNSNIISKISDKLVSRELGEREAERPLEFMTVYVASNDRKKDCWRLNRTRMTARARKF